MWLLVEKAVGTVLSSLFAAKEKYSKYYKPKDVPETLTVESSAFENNGFMPWKYGGPRCGRNTCPPLKVSNVPDNAESLVFVMEDVDAPLPRPIVHTAAYNIDASKTDFKEGYFDNNDTLEGSTTFGLAFRGRTGYVGPGPIINHGPHRYVFQFYALEAMSEPIKPSANVDELVEIVSKHGIAKGRLVGKFERTDAKHHIDM